MKYLINCLVYLLLFCSSSFAQDNGSIFPLNDKTNKIYYSKVVELPGVHLADIEKRIDRFIAVDKEKFFIVGGIKTGDKEWSSGRLRWLGVDDEYGIQKRGENIASGRVLLAYGNSFSKCVMFLGIYADVSVEWKDEKCRIIITDFYYRHSTLGSPPMRRGFVDNKGKLHPYGAPLEYLLDKPTLCENDLPEIQKWINNKIIDLIQQFNITVSDKKSESDW